MPSFLSFPQAAVYTPQTLPHDPKAPVAVLTKDRDDAHILSQYAQKFSELLIVQEVWKDILPQAALLISSAICGGEIRERFRTAANTRACWLLIEPVSHRFPLPCHDAAGEHILTPPVEAGFYSSTLCCCYRHLPTPDGGSMVLWDTENTLAEKIALAKEAGFLGYVLASQ